MSRDIYRSFSLDRNYEFWYFDYRNQKFLFLNFPFISTP